MQLNYQELFFPFFFTSTDIFLFMSVLFNCSHLSSRSIRLKTKTILRLCLQTRKRRKTPPKTLQFPKRSDSCKLRWVDPAAPDSAGRVRVRARPLPAASSGTAWPAQPDHSTASSRLVRELRFSFRVVYPFRVCISRGNTAPVYPPLFSIIGAMGYLQYCVLVCARL